MSPEFYSIIGTGLVLAGLIVPKVNTLGKDISDLRERMAHMEGLLEGLREAITQNRSSK